MAINGSNTGSILGDVRSIVGAAARGQSAEGNGAQQARKPSDFWLNIGTTVDGSNGDPLFVSLPSGLALDDMKPQQVKGNNAEFIALAQAKNALLAMFQQAAAKLEPGQRMVLENVTVELYRRAEPSQTASADTNPLIEQMQRNLAGG